MVKHSRWVLLAVFSMLVALLPLVPAGAASTDVTISEIRIDQPGSDVDEYFELAGIAGTSLDGLTYLVIGDGAAGSGVIESVTDLTGQSIPTSGYFVAAESTFTLGTADLVTSLDFENSDNVTHLLVSGFTGANGDDLDTNDDGTLDATPWTAVVDSVALIETVGSGDLVYSTTTVGPDGPYVPGHVYRCGDAWEIGSFSGGKDTPGSENLCPGVAPPVTATIHDIQYTMDPGGASPFEGLEVVTEGVVTGVFGNKVFIQDGTGPWSGLYLYAPSPIPSVGDLVRVKGFVEEYFDLTEIGHADLWIIGSDSVPDPEVLAPGDMNQEQWESVFVRAENVTVDNDDLGFGEWSVTDGSGTARVDDLGEYAYAPEAGNSLVYVQGPLYYSFSNFKIEPRGNGDIELLTTICAVQGDGWYSPLEDVKVKVPGVVYAYEYNGFYLEDLGCDGDAATSDGVFVFSYKISTKSWAPDVGDSVFVEGYVSEYFGLTEISASWITNNGPGTLPDPVVIDPVAAQSSGYYETLEGMRVELAEGQAYVGTNKFGESFVVPGMTTTRVGRTDDRPEMFAIDDGLLGSDGLPLFAWQVAENVVGAMSYSYSNYKLNIENPDTATVSGDASVANVIGEAPAGALPFATWNLENVFDEFDPNPDIGVPAVSPAEQATKRAKLALGVVDWMATPAVIAVQEVENLTLLQAIADEINALAGTSYEAVLEEGNDPRGIDVGFLIDTDQVAYDNVRQIGKDWISDGACEGGAGDNLVYDRVPLAVDVTPLGSSETFTFVSNHFKSKFGGTSANNYFEDCRVEQAEKLAGALDGMEHVVVLGDLNAFRDAETIQTFEAAGFTDMVDLIPASRRFSFVFQGRTQFLDHVMVTPDLVAALAGVDSPKFVNDAPVPMFEDDASTAYGASDHDPIVADLVFDTSPPQINATTDVWKLSPANHKLVRIDIDLTVVDDFDPSPAVVLEVTSSEPEDGLGDGDTAPDIIVEDLDTVFLRAERSGKGLGRVYTLTYTATDAVGNQSTLSISIFVPHDSGKRPKLK